MKLIFTLILCGLACAVQAQFGFNNVAVVGSFSATTTSGGGSCSVWQSSSLNNDANFNLDYNSQRIQVTENATLCQFDVWLNDQTGGGDSTVHVEAWATADRTGTQYGGSSNTNLITSGTSVKFSFVWATGKPAVTTGQPLYIHVMQDTGTTGYPIGFITGGTGYLDDVFCIYGTGGIYSSGRGDFIFDLFKQ